MKFLIVVDMQVDFITGALGSADAEAIVQNVVEKAKNFDDPECDYGQCNVEDWTEIVAIAAGPTHTLGLKSDGTVVAVGNNDHGQCDVKNWNLS